ncbi:cupredoxin family copper-binding protein [Actinosynnema sp. NPDC051121]|nr:cupredoxin family copper-binding protein [Saccharothrix sp.]
MRALLAAAFLLVLSAPAATAQSQGHEIPIARYAYQPAEMTVRVGETVTWTNQDQAPHDVVTTAGPAVLQSPLLAQGQSWSFTFTVPGDYDYYCSVHPDMRGRVTVLPDETTAPPPAVEQPQAANPVPPAAAPTTTETVSSPEVAAAVQPQPQPQARSLTPPPSNGLQPMLLLAGLVAAVTTFCLLLLGSRPERG